VRKAKPFPEDRRWIYTHGKAKSHEEAWCVHPKKVMFLSDWMGQDKK
jgi:hypothetical protein